MRNVSVLQQAFAAGLVLLSLVVIRDWVRERDPSRGALALALWSLAVVSVVGQMNTITDYRFARVISPFNLVLFALSGYALLLFRHTMLPMSRKILIGTGVLNLLVVVATFVVRLPVGPSPKYTPTQFAVVMSLVAMWCLCVGEPAFRFWLVSRGLAAVQRARLRALVAAYGLIVLVLFLAVLATGGSSGNRQSPGFRTFTQILTLGFIPLLYVSFAPPRWLRRAWRARDEDALREAMKELLASEDRSGLAMRSLQWATRLMGTDAGFIRDTYGNVLAECGDIEPADIEAVPDAPAPHVVRLGGSRVAVAVPLHADEPGTFAVVSSAITPVFGSEEIGWFEQYVASVSTALDRARLIEEMRHTERGLVEAQEIAHIGSWRWDLTTDNLTWSRQQYLIYGLEPGGPLPTEDQLRSMMHPADRGRADAVVEEARRGGAPFAIEYRVVRPSGEVRWVHGRARLDFDPATGTPVAMIGTTQDITERKERESTAALLAAIVRSSDDSIVAVSPEGNINTWNAGAEHLYGWTAEEAIGSQYSMLWPPDRAEEGARIRDRALSGESIEHLETRRRRKNGTLVDVSLTVSPVRDEHGEVIGVSSISRDIGPQRRVEEALRQALEHERTAAERLREADKLKDEFLATVSHELRTPLALIVGFTDVLGSTWQSMDEERRRDLVRRIDHAGANMTQLIEQLLDFSRLQAGRVRLAPRPVALRDAVEDVVTKLKVLDASHDVSIDIPQEMRVEADPQGLERVLGNLLSNASKFSPAGSEISVDARQSDGSVQVSVRDKGVGISSAELPLIFERFYQVATGSSSHKGSGLGLAIAKRYVEMSGGRIWAESFPGRGSTFSFTLPVPRSA